MTLFKPTIEEIDFSTLIKVHLVFMQVTKGHISFLTVIKPC